MDHLTRAVTGDVVGDQVMCGLQKVEVTMDVADGVEMHGSLPVAGPEGLTPPDPRGRFVDEE